SAQSARCVTTSNRSRSLSPFSANAVNWSTSRWSSEAVFCCSRCLTILGSAVIDLRSEPISRSPELPPSFQGTPFQHFLATSGVEYPIPGHEHPRPWLPQPGDASFYAEPSHLKCACAAT